MTLTTDELRQIVETDHVQCGDAAAMARELLAYREAVPVIAAWQHKGEPWRIILDRNIEEVRKNSGSWNPLYTAPPATAVPDERAAFNAWNNEDNLPIAGIPAKNAAWLAWQARAMLAQPVSQGYKLPDGYKLVPADPTPAHIAPFIKHCCENESWVRQAWREMLAAATEGGN